MEHKINVFAKKPIILTVLLIVIGILILALTLIIKHFSNNYIEIVVEIFQAVGLELAISSLVVFITYLVIGNDNTIRDAIKDSMADYIKNEDALLPIKIFHSESVLPEYYQAYLYSDFIKTNSDIYYGDRAINLLRRFKTLLKQEQSIATSSILEEKNLIILLPNYKDEKLMSTLGHLGKLRERTLEDNKKSKKNYRSEPYTGENNHLIKEKADVLRTLFVLRELSLLDQLYDKLNINIKVCFYNDYPPYRIEIMDDIVYVSHFPIEGNPMSSTIVYKKGSTFYQAYSNYLTSILKRSINLEGQQFSETAYINVMELTDDFFVSSLKEIATEYKSCSDEDIISKFKAWYAEVKQFDVDIKSILDKKSA